MKIILIFLTLIQFINSQNWFDYLKDNQLIAQKSRISNLNGFELLASVYNITDIDLYDNKIMNITKIKYMINVTKLNLGRNLIINIDAISVLQQN